MATTEDIQQAPFVKQLAANDRPTRDKALLSLRTYLSGRRTLPHIELLKLHKGLFYSLWMCDRPIPQQKLATALASLVSVLPAETVVPFLRAFWQTMQREWNLVDVLRMEKFLLLVRRYLCASFEVLKESGWDEGRIGEVLDVMAEVPLNVEDMRIPMGLRFHVIDIYVDELERAGALGNDEEEAKNVPLDVLLEPLRRLAAKSPTKTVRSKAKEALADERLPGNATKDELDGEDGEKGDENEDNEWGGIEE
ncbi:Uncharacterized protein BP5553_02222 [Venustampulla echinocandica]|uniref:Uncharacterized protein n=1 Tax=Venustampulla echinocandica TaxID=2656787 RepID=A0A370U3D2_9HELO|nr:Uncharacterized protein BP5553_02222 [Venustampulla echinocandica]RDL42243.1 Uncharacterized protein BP5553_02222 [Venustampulla echinocandica]